MATGAPDWHTLDWKVETVARPTLIYPSGKVILYDDFEKATLNWKTTGSAGSEVSLSTVAAYSKDASLRLTTGTVSPFWAGATRYIGLPPTNKLGVQFAYRLGVAALTYMRITIDFYAGTRISNAGVRYDYVNKIWQYIDSTKTWVDLSGTSEDLTEDSPPWQFVKLTADFENNKYLSLYSNNQQYDLSNLGIFNEAGVHAKMLAVIIRLDASGGGPTGYFDEAVITDEG